MDTTQHLLISEVDEEILINAVSEHPAVPFEPLFEDYQNFALNFGGRPVPETYEVIIVEVRQSAIDGANYIVAEAIPHDVDPGASDVTYDAIASKGNRVVFKLLRVEGKIGISELNTLKKLKAELMDTILTFVTEEE